MGDHRITATELDPPGLDYVNEYLGWKPAEHDPDCSPQAGWQVRTYDQPTIGDGPYPVGMRAYCTGCGVSYELIARSGFRDEWGNACGPSVYRDSHRRRGYVAKPRRVLGLWLHAEGRRVGSIVMSSGDSQDFVTYYLTREQHPPASAEEIVGVVSWSMGQRGGVRWEAGLVTGRPADRTGYVHVDERAPKPFPSPTAAARWIARTLSDSSSS